MTSSRRDFLRRCALLAAGTVAADQLDILERLTHRKVFTTGAPFYRGSADYLIKENAWVYDSALFSLERPTSLRFENHDGSQVWTLGPSEEALPLEPVPSIGYVSALGYDTISVEC